MAESAVLIWRSAQLDEMEIQVHPELTWKEVTLWQSPVFEPDTDTSEDRTRTQAELEIRVMFPRIIANRYHTVETSLDVAGRFASSESESRLVTICLHHGIGLAGSAPLVKRGKLEAENIGAEREKEQLL